MSIEKTKQEYCEELLDNNGAKYKKISLREDITLERFLKGSIDCASFPVEVLSEIEVFPYSRTEVDIVMYILTQCEMLYPEECERKDIMEIIYNTLEQLTQEDINFSYLLHVSKIGKMGVYCGYMYEGLYRVIFLPVLSDEYLAKVRWDVFNRVKDVIFK